MEVATACGPQAQAAAVDLSTPKLKLMYIAHLLTSPPVCLLPTCLLTPFHFPGELMEVAIACGRLAQAAAVDLILGKKAAAPSTEDADATAPDAAAAEGRERGASPPGQTPGAERMEVDGEEGGEGEGRVGGGAVVPGDDESIDTGRLMEEAGREGDEGGCGDTAASKLRRVVRRSAAAAAREAARVMAAAAAGRGGGQGEEAGGGPGGEAAAAAAGGGGQEGGLMQRLGPAMAERLRDYEGEGLRDGVQGLGSRD